MSIEFSRREEFAIVKIDRTAAMNALNYEMLSEIGRVLDEVQSSDVGRARVDSPESVVPDRKEWAVWIADRGEDGGMISRWGVAVTRIHDSAGFISQRMLASIVNLACDIAQRRVASSTDIDLAVRCGRGSTKGSPAWGCEIGSRRILQILENLFVFYGDPRYRPSPWLKRRAIDDLPLSTRDIYKRA